ncbi:MAG: ATP-binding cassette domain-containing protein [Candidatus Delongbacteria bacterium]|nr:ATP-binding cassette domain-containing protein [Candidatus Delongbacteria bacterium]
MPNKDEIKLEKSKRFIPDDSCIFVVKEGAVNIYIIPLNNPHFPETVLITTAKEGDMLPALEYQDIDYNDWRLCYEAITDSAILEKCNNEMSEEKKEEFLDNVSITGSLGMSFEERIIEYYKQSILNKKITDLSKYKIVITTSNDAYLVLEGSINVFITPLDKTEDEETVFLCKAKKGEVLPSVAYTDIDYKKWGLLLSASTKDTVVSVIKNGTTRKLKNNFLTQIGLEQIGDLTFEESIINHYKKQVLTSNTATIREIISAYDAEIKGIEILSEGILGSKEKVVWKSGQKSEYLWDTVEYLCKHLKTFVDENIRLGKTDYSLEEIAAEVRLTCRDIILEENWHLYDCGELIVYKESSNSPVACYYISSKNCYFQYDPSNGIVEKITNQTAQMFKSKAASISRTLPEESLNWKEFFRFGLKKFEWVDFFWMVVLAIAIALINTLLPSLNQKIYDDYIPIGSVSLLFQVGCVIGSFMIGNVFLSIVKNLFSFRIASRIKIAAQDAIYDRVFNLSGNFLRKYESADLATRMMSIGSLTFSLYSIAIQTSVTIIFFLVYFIRLMKYSPKLTWIALLFLAGYSVIDYWISTRAINFDRNIESNRNKSNSILYQYISGIEKIRMAGVEDHMLNVYLGPYIETRNLELKKSKWSIMSRSLSDNAIKICLMIFYFIIIKKNQDITTGSFVAFISAFGLFSANVMSLIQGAVGIVAMQPLLERFKPIISAMPEREKGVVPPPENFDGRIKIENVFFAYDEGAENVINNVDETINDGEYIGIVGASGCGKSTLLKLLLGFEKPQNGKIIYGDQDLSIIDKQLLRKSMGVVLQDGGLIAGSIQENITITNNKATQEEIWEVIRAVALEEDIKDMPMGLQTILSEDGGTISGGQKQRILIARALINKPKIIFFDEATSALDNITQAQVSDTLKEQKGCTKIVIAHRLSTIKQCDRIFVMEKGSVVEKGNYEELMEKKGLFYKLASRQIA